MLVPLDPSKTLITPAVYDLVIKDGKDITLVFHKDRYEEPPKIYGKTLKQAQFFWNSFARNEGKSLGIALTGNSGAGKTTVLELLSNIAIDNKMAVIIVTDNTKNSDLLNYIKNLENVVIVFDEFGKKFRLEDQGKMLSMLSDQRHNKKLFIITENDKNYLYKYIRNAPHRVRYWREYIRIDEETVKEVCDDYEVTDSFREELYEIYKQSTSFTFTQLMTLVNEHKLYPEFTIAEMLEFLNLELSNKNKIVVVRKLFKKNKETDEMDEITEYSTDNSNVLYSEFSNGGRNIWVYPRQASSFMITDKKVKNITDEFITAIDGDYEIHLEIV